MRLSSNQNKLLNRVMYRIGRKSCNVSIHERVADMVCDNLGKGWQLIGIFAGSVTDFITICQIEILKIISHIIKIWL
jgi:hypothetical protein